MSATPLPTDILLLILDAIDDEPESQPTLRACALTCRLLSRVAQARLFGDIYLGHTVDELSAFTRTIHESTHIAAMVNTLSIYMDYGAIDDFPMPPHVVAQLTGLQSARLGNSRDTYHNSAIVFSFFKLFGSLTTLTDVTFASISFPNLAEMIRLVWSFPFVQSFTLENCYIEAASPRSYTIPDPNAYPGHCRNLRSLSWLEMFIPLDLSLPIWGARVTTLTVVANRYEAQGVIVNISGTSPFPRLEYLELDLLDRPLGLTADVIRYLATDSLRRITVRHVIYHRYNFDEGRVLDLVATKFRQIKLDSLLSEGVLRRLERLLWNCSHVGVRQFVALGDHIRAMVPNATRRGVFVVEES